MLRVVYATENSNEFKNIVEVLEKENISFKVNESKFNEKTYFEILAKKEEAKYIEDIIFNLDN